MKNGMYNGEAITLVRGANPGDAGFTAEMKNQVLIIDKDGKKLVVPASEVMVSAEGNI